MEEHIKDEAARFRPRVVMEITPNKDGGYSVQRLADPATNTPAGVFDMPSLDDYEPLNEKAEEMVHNDLLRRGFRPEGPREAEHKEQGELVASGRHFLTVMLEGMQKMCAKYGLNFAIQQSPKLYVRSSMLSEERCNGGYTTHFYDLGRSKP